MSTVVHQGYLKKWSGSKNNWESVFCKLLSSGWFQWFDNPTSSSPKRSIDIRVVSAFLAFGSVLNQVPCKPASLCAADINRAIGVPHEPHKGTKMSFFVCANDADMNQWANRMSTLIQGGTMAPPPSGPSYPPYAAGPPPPYQPPSGPAYGFAMGPQPMPYDTGSFGYPAAPPTAQPPSYGYQQPGYGSPMAAYQTSFPSYQPLQPAPAPYSGQLNQPVQNCTARSGEQYRVVYVDGKPKKKKMSGLKSAAVGLASGVAGGYLASRLFGGVGGGLFGRGWGGGYGGGWGGGWGSWSSLSSLSWSD